MSTQAALPKDHPAIKAWAAIKDTDEFRNALEWAVRTLGADGREMSSESRIEHAKGAMWFAFLKGMDCRQVGSENEDPAAAALGRIRPAPDPDPRKIISG